MTDDNATKIVCCFMLMIGLILNGCQPSVGGINEYNLIDENALAEGMIESACLVSGRIWKQGECQ